MRFVSSMLLLVVAAGCSNIFAPAGINGRWTQTLLPPGSSLEMDLVTHGSTVSGTGTWSGEACCFGSLEVTGTIHHGAVHLDITQTIQAGAPGTTGSTIISHFDGRIIVGQLLRGTLKPDPDPANETGQEVTYIPE